LPVSASCQTVADRSIPIRLNRKSKGDEIRRFRYKIEKEQAASIVASLKEWADNARVIAELAEAEPGFPPELSDRQWDIWEPLFAIADLAGADWGVDARHTAVALHAMSYTDDSVGVLALDHIRQAFDGQVRMSTDELLHALVGRDDGPWPSWWANDVEAGRTKGPGSRLARILKPFDIKPGQLWMDGVNVRGYEADWFAKAWEIYLPPLSSPTDARTLDDRPDMASDQHSSDLATLREGERT
jgi:hypothetical protein